MLHIQRLLFELDRVDQDKLRRASQQQQRRRAVHALASRVRASRHGFFRSHRAQLAREDARAVDQERAQYTRRACQVCQSTRLLVLDYGQRRSRESRPKFHS